MLLGDILLGSPHQHNYILDILHYYMQWHCLHLHLIITLINIIDGEVISTTSRTPDLGYALRWVAELHNIIYVNVYCVCVCVEI